VEALALLGGATFLETYAGRLPGPAVVAHCRRHHAAEAWRVVLSDPSTAAFVLEAPLGAPVGYALLTTADLPRQRDGDCELRRIYVLRAWQGAGNGLALLESAAGEARARGASRLLLGVWGENARALAFYARQGFATIGTRRFMVGDLACDDLVLARGVGPVG
jgi:ribosomal protein S18 acetylase RimI-like enzyme